MALETRFSDSGCKDISGSEGRDQGERERMKVKEEIRAAMLCSENEWLDERTEQEGKEVVEVK